ncbi:hypothetical protein [Microbispora bryophytorum]|uniref:hypothetical protein n=1 Tax=Microbispora bryophytorum TaxID=1460882 RepID=UPI0034039C83
MEDKEPFRAMVRLLNARGLRFVDMEHQSRRARSSAWWNNMANYGAWRGPGDARTSPPDPEALEGIAKLFGVTHEEVRKMIAADWYGVYPPPEVASEVRRLEIPIMRLSSADRELVETLIRRLMPPDVDRE